MARKFVQIAAVKTGSNDYAVTVVAVDSAGGVWTSTSLNARGGGKAWEAWAPLPDLPDTEEDRPKGVFSG